MKPYYADDSVTLYHGDALDVLRGMPDGSVNCVCTSPPYFGLRDYGVEGQYGLESSPAEYVETMRSVFAEVRRVLADDGTLWLNLGDSYSNTTNGKPPTNTRNKSGHPAARAAWIAPKNLMGMPWRVAFALQDDGWILRNAIIWNKSNAMPESVTDRLSNRYEHLFMFSKSRRYYFDLDAIREGRAYTHPPRETNKHAVGRGDHRYGGNDRSMHATGEYLTDGKNPGDVWTIPTQPFGEAHFACMPTDLAECCVSAGSRAGNVIHDPFSGSGTTGLAATKLGRRYVGIDLNAEYLDLSLRTRLAQTALIDGAAS